MKVVVTSNSSKIAKRYLNMARNMPGLVQQALGDLAREEGIPLFQNTVKTWTHQPTFTTVPTARGWAVNVDPVLPYRYVDEGTTPHLITPRNRPLLRFTGPYHAKTKPGVLASYKGGRGKVWVSSRKVKHPGTQPRNFRDIIMRRIQARAAGYVRDKLREASYGAGQGL